MWTSLLRPPRLTTVSDLLLLGDASPDLRIALVSRLCCKGRVLFGPQSVYSGSAVLAIRTRARPAALARLAPADRISPLGGWTSQIHSDQQGDAPIPRHGFSLLTWATVDAAIVDDHAIRGTCPRIGPTPPRISITEAKSSESLTGEARPSTPATPSQRSTRRGAIRCCASSVPDSSSVGKVADVVRQH